MKAPSRFPLFPGFLPVGIGISALSALSAATALCWDLANGRRCCFQPDLHCSWGQEGFKEWPESLGVPAF